MARQLRFDLGPCLFFGDNLDILPAYIADESVDLVYLDPPFNSKRSYNAIFKHVDGTPAAAQIKAFDDTWTWTIESERTFRRTVEQGGDVSRVLRAFREILGASDMLAYLTMMAPRLVELLRRVLKADGSLFLHCDPTASHYLKLLLDGVFGPTNFVNEVIWHYRKWSTGKALFQRNHDVILFYARSSSKSRIFNQLYMDRAPSTLKRFGKARIVSGYDTKGKRVPSQMASDESEGVRMDDVWDIGRVPPIKQLYPTEKPIALLERIIEATSNPGSVVLDPFCGCGTAIDAAQSLGRRWIGIDITRVAIEVIQDRLVRDHPGLDYSVRGIPTTMDEVDFLADRDKYAFQQWVCDRLGIDADIRKGADHGIDGELVRYTVAGKPWRAVVSVKGGGVNVTQIRDLRGTVEREKADTGIFITRKPPTKPMVDEAVAAGLGDDDIPKIQILTAADLLAGKAPAVPLPQMVAQRPLEAVAQPEKGSAVPTHKRQTA